MGVHLGDSFFWHVGNVEAFEKTKRGHGNNFTSYPNAQDIVCYRSLDLDDCLLSGLYIFERDARISQRVAGCDIRRMREELVTERHQLLRFRRVEPGFELFEDLDSDRI